MNLNTKCERNKGITLIALVVTIIVLLLLAGISITMLTGQNGILNRAAEAKEKTGMAQSEEKVKLAVMAAIADGNGTLTIENLKKELANNGITIPDSATFPVTVTTGNSTYQIDQYGKLKIANLEANWTAADSTNLNDDWYAYKDNSGTKAQVNAPKLADGMTAIKYSIDSDLTAGSKWANAMTKDGSMWVWIPRYAYRITYNDAKDRSKGGTIDIAFLKGTTNDFLDSGIQGNVETSISNVTYTENANGTKSQNQWLLEPAFTFGDKNIEGFWFAKFEASNTDGYGADASTANNVNLTMRIKPNVTNWINITAANIFTACLNLTSSKTYFDNVSNVDTHMTKNVEWGAVAYLSHSKYGLNGKEICINTNSSDITGVGSGETASRTSVTDQYNTTKGVTASTTKNVYGIYDMSGGAYEYVAACYKGYTNKLTANTDTTYINKYIDVYDDYASTKYGDAVFETSSSSSGSTSWFSDSSRSVNSYSPVFLRGGFFYQGSDAGLFNFDYNPGGSSSNNGFRPVCVVK